MTTEFPAMLSHQFKPYSHERVSAILSDVAKTFGPPGVTKRWHFKVPFDDTGANNWALDFYFRDKNDLLIFCLKHLGRHHEFTAL